MKVEVSSPNAERYKEIFMWMCEQLEIPFDQPVLDSATEKGLDLPFSCKGGMCCTCRAKLNDGDVEMGLTISRFIPDHRI